MPKPKPLSREDREEIDAAIAANRRAYLDREARRDTVRVALAAFALILIYLACGALAFATLGGVIWFVVRVARLAWAS